MEDYEVGAEDHGFEVGIAGGEQKLFKVWDRRWPRKKKDDKVSLYVDEFMDMKMTKNDGSESFCGKYVAMLDKGKDYGATMSSVFAGCLLA